MVGEPPPLQLEVGADGEKRVTASLVSLMNLFQQSIIRKLNGRLRFGNGDHATQSGNIDGQWIEVVTPSADVEFAVDHGLERLPAGYIVARANKACNVYDSNVGGWNDRTIYLKCDTGTVTLRIVII